MGRSLIQAIHAETDAVLAAAIVSPQSSHLGSDAGELAGIGRIGVITVGALEQVIDQIDVLIDFTLPEPTLAYVSLCAQHGIPVVVGTTGLTDSQVSQLRLFAQNTPICFSANFSTGVNLCMQLLEQAAKVLAEEADIEIIETHHRHKIDAPSGTALALGRVIANTLGRDLKTDAIYGREGITGARDRKTIGFSTIRGGVVVGDHTVLFACEGERVEITHKASSRLAFSRGAIRAARWLYAQKINGLYSMRDVLDL
jgi:4-hydroxy-tetrahydrodipicolinate reductase